MAKLEHLEPTTTEPMTLRMLNDQLMLLERAFLIPEGLPGRAGDRHAIFARAKFNHYGSATFPGLVDLTHEIDLLEGEEAAEQWEKVKKHISDLMIIVRNAADFLSPFHQI